MATNNFANGIGKEYADRDQRVRFLKDNADAVVEKTYMRKYTPEELQSHKEELANTDILINDIEEEKKAVLDEFKEQGDAMVFKYHDCPKLTELQIKGLVKNYDPNKLYRRIDEHHFRTSDTNY